MLCLLTKMLFRRLAGRLVYTYIAIAYGLTLVYAVALWVISETACRLVGYEKMSLSHCT